MCVTPSIAWLALRPVILIGAACGLVEPPPSVLMDRCTKMYRAWNRYETAHSPNQSGQRARTELAHYRCQERRFDEGMDELEVILRRDLIPVPERVTATGSSHADRDEANRFQPAPVPRISSSPR